MKYANIFNSRASFQRYLLTKLWMLLATLGSLAISLILHVWMKDLSHPRSEIITQYTLFEGLYCFHLKRWRWRSSCLCTQCTFLTHHQETLLKVFLIPSPNNAQHCKFRSHVILLITWDESGSSETWESHLDCLAEHLQSTVNRTRTVHKKWKSEN